MLPAVGVAAAVLAVVAAARRAPAADAQPAPPQAAPAGDTPAAAAAPAARHAATVSYHEALTRLGIANGAPPASALPPALVTELRAAASPGHAADTASLAEQIARYQANAENVAALSPAAQQWVSDKLAGLVGASLSMVPLLGGLLKGAWSADYANATTTETAPGPSPAAIQQAAELAPGPEGFSDSWVRDQIAGLVRAYNAAPAQQQAAILTLLRAALQYGSFHAAISAPTYAATTSLDVTDALAANYAQANAAKETRSAPGWQADVRASFAGLL